MESRHPEFLMLLEEMVLRKQIELLGGGSSPPCCPPLSSSDRLGQIECLTTFIRKNFGRRPRGCRIPGYAWGPSLASSPSRLRVWTSPSCRFPHFRAAGFGADGLLRPGPHGGPGQGPRRLSRVRFASRASGNPGDSRRPWRPCGAGTALRSSPHGRLPGGGGRKGAWSRSVYESPDVPGEDISRPSARTPFPSRP
ncbi:MAG: hypothetical protein MZU97_12315 [Bacillus subtilis]|nr:hypothetical protein [Bacillus subtilis]